MNGFFCVNKSGELYFFDDESLFETVSIRDELVRCTKPPHYPDHHGIDVFDFDSGTWLDNSQIETAANELEQARNRSALLAALEQKIEQEISARNFKDLSEVTLALNMPLFEFKARNLVAYVERIWILHEQIFKNERTFDSIEAMLLSEDLQLSTVLNEI